MYNTNEILNRLNQDKRNNAIALADITSLSFEEFTKLANNVLPFKEIKFIYKQAQNQLKDNALFEAKILTRTNPQLIAATKLGVTPLNETRDYNELFGERASQYTNPGSVASMFSPAGYLTEMYREAQDLHPTDSKYYLNTRRPDLASLALTQDNMDNEVTTLSLSNTILLNSIMNEKGISYDDVLKLLSTERRTGLTPYHAPYEIIHETIALQDPNFSALTNAPEIIKNIDPASLLAITADISPELYDILTEEITPENEKALFQKNFGSDSNIAFFLEPKAIASYYNITEEELAQYISIGNTIDETGSVYSNGILSSYIFSKDRNIEAYRITRVKGLNYDSNLYYMDLHYNGDNKFYVTVKFKIGGGKTSIRMVTPEDKYLAGIPDPTEANIAYQSPTFTLTNEELKNDVQLLAYRYKEGSDSSIQDSSTAYFTFESFSSYVFLLKLNKAIRLCQAAGISPTELESIVNSDNEERVINASVLGKVFYSGYYKNHYGISLDDALILCHSDISQRSDGSALSQFDKLFNNPPLGGQQFTPDDSPIPISPSESEDDWRRAVLKRAFNVNDAELYNLCQIFDREIGDSIDASLSVLSRLYFIRLLASVHHLSVYELNALLLLSPYKEISLSKAKEEELSQLIEYLYQVTQWLNEQNWTVYDLYVMCTDNYDTIMTPEIQNLLTTLRNGLTETEELTNEELITAMAPFIAASVQLDTSETAKYILLWADSIKPSGLTVEGFWKIAQNETISSTDSPKVVAFCQVLAQLAMITRTLQLSALELSVLITPPSAFRTEKNSLANNVTTLMAITRFHQWVNESGNAAGQMLTALRQQELTTKLFAKNMGLNETIVTQALEQVTAASSDQPTNKSAIFTSWQEIDGALQWINTADLFQITPNSLAKVISLKYIADNSQSTPSYEDWQNIANLLQAGLDEQQTSQLQETIDEKLSRASCGYYIRFIADSSISNRDDLYNYLLIDNQVSAQIKTTLIAEAIASVQLYINRALADLEPEVQSEKLTKQYFKDWETYNKRYSTWAGVSELVYYPENYIDPMMRIGQTNMMDTLLQSISQSHINTDTVEDAFKTYLTSFEEVANLTVISGYHDNKYANEGKTWFIGVDSSSPPTYYQRSVDHSKSVDGRISANAWSEWQEINSALNVFSGMVRPVIYNNRLHIVWLELKTHTEKDLSTEEEITIEQYTLNVSYQKYDGGWSAPKVYPLTNSSVLNIIKDNKRDFYLSYLPYDETIIITFYLAQSDIQDNNTISVTIDKFYDLTLPAKKSYFAIYKDQLNTAIGEGKIPAIVYTELPTDIDTVVTNEYMNSGYYFTTPTFVPKVTLDDSNSKDTYYINVDTSLKCFTKSTDPEVVSLIDEIQVIDKKWKGTDILYSKFQPMTLTELKDAIKEFEIEENINIVYHEIATANTLIGNNYWLAFNLPESLKKLDLFSFSGFKRNNSEYQELSILLSENGIMFHAIALSKNVVLKKDDKIIFSIATDNNPNNEIHILGFTLGEIIEPTSEDSTLEIKINNATVKTYPYVNDNYVINDTFRQALDGKQQRVPFSIKLTGKSGTGASVYEGNFEIEWDAESYTPIIINKTATNAQYIQQNVYRTRLNTLFAYELVKLAESGIDSILSLKAQQINEPQPGEGGYITVGIPKYNAAQHGNSNSVKLELTFGDDKNKYVFWSGQLLKTNQNTNLFIPYLKDKGTVTVFMTTKKESRQNATITISTNGISKIDRPTDWSAQQDFDVQKNDKTTEFMDFQGANALYFWELFYYTPSLIAQRFLNEQDFAEANRWLNYIFNPSNNLDADKNYWYVRPLLEDTSWNANPLDSVDPDAIAQNDPMHYKVATFMRFLDLLIARGDIAYRQQERDTLNEAKIWYIQALYLLGDQPNKLQNYVWSSPSLSAAAKATLQRDYQNALSQIRLSELTPQSRTANSLTNLFLPQLNEKLLSYWQLLAQRLYNLRHNLTIDGLPLSLPFFSTPADPKALLSAAVASAQGGAALPKAFMPLNRFAIMLESAKSVTSQLIQFGANILSIIERQDAEALAELLQNQAQELALSNIRLQEANIAEIEADRQVLEQNRLGVQTRLESYTKLYDENVNVGEKQSMDLALTSSILASTGDALHMAAAALDLVPNIYGFAVGGAKYGAVFNALAIGTQIASSSTGIASQRIGQSEIYRRRREEWKIQCDEAQSQLNQIDAQINSLAIRHKAAILQKDYLETQQAQSQAQLEFLQRKFSNKALYNWLRGQLASIYFQLYDSAASRCLLAQTAYQWEVNDASVSFIKPGAWQDTYAGLMSGEKLMLNLIQMEDAYFKQDRRALEVTRTISLAEVYKALEENKDFVLSEKINDFLNSEKDETAGDNNGQLSFSEQQLHAMVKLSALSISDDYPASLGKNRRIKQISVSLPALVGPYQDIQAILNYTGSLTDFTLPKGCSAIAVSHGVRDSGLFQLDFNDGKYLPFEGIPVNNSGSLTLSFPNARTKQKPLLLSLNDIILHICYTITD